MLRTFAGGAIFAEQTGTGAPRVLALHGWQRNHHDFDQVLGPVETNASRCATPRVALDALALDLPGFGTSPPPKSAWGTNEYARALEPVLAELTPRPVIVGHSFGALVALRIACRFPGRVGSLVLCGAPLFRADPRARRTRPSYRAIRILARRGLLSQQRLESARRRYGSRDYAEAIGVMREVLIARLAEDYEPDLRSIDIPVKLVWGELDRAAPLAVGEHALTMLKDGELTVLSGVGHLVPTEAPFMLRARIEDFLA